MPQSITIKRLHNFNALRENVTARPGSRRGLVFRGYWARQAEPEAPQSRSELEDPEPYPGLLTGLERVCLSVDNTLDQAPHREVAMVREFMRRAHHYLHDVPREEDWFEWLALMQHHGAPTRFLDWTYSLYVAAYFALVHTTRKVKADIAIWMVNTNWCLDTSDSVCATAGYPMRVLRKRPVRRGTEAKASEDLLGGACPECVWPINPFRLSERLTVQRGVFLAPGNVRRSFVASLTALSGHESDANVTCFVLPRAEARNLRRELYDANVSETTLFPGIDGFARSLWVSAHYLDVTGLVSFLDL
jgi:hypothetical protein